MPRTSFRLSRALVLFAVPLLLVACQTHQPRATPEGSERPERPEGAPEARAVAVEVQSLYGEWRTATEDGAAGAEPEALRQELEERFAELLRTDAAAVARFDRGLGRALGRVRTLEPDEAGTPPDGSARIGDRYYDASDLEAVLAVLAPDAFGEQDLEAANARAVTVRAQGPLNPREGAKTAILSGESTTACVPYWTSWDTSTTRATTRYDVAATRGPGLCLSGPVTVRNVKVTAQMHHQGKVYYAWPVSLHPREITASRTFHRGLSLRTLAWIASFAHPEEAKPLTDVVFEYEVDDVKRSDVCTVDFDDGTREQVDCGAGSVTHSYQKAGTYEPSMVVQDPSGRVLHARGGGEIKVHSGIKIRLGPMNLPTGSLHAYFGDPVSFDFTIENAEHTPLLCEIDWGDGESDTFDCSFNRSTPAHVYVIPGIPIKDTDAVHFFRATIEVRDATDSRSSTFKVFGVLSFDWRPEVISFTFNGRETRSATVGSGETYDIAWEVSDPFGVTNCDYITRNPAEPLEEARFELGEHLVYCTGSRSHSWENLTEGPITVSHAVYGRHSNQFEHRAARIEVTVRNVPMPTASAAFADSRIDVGESTTFTVTASGSGIACERRLWNDDRQGPGDFRPSACAETAPWSPDHEGEWKLEFRVTDEHGRTATASDTISVAVPEGYLAVSCVEEAEMQTISCVADPVGWLEPGEYVVSATAPGYSCLSRTAEVIAGETTYLTIYCR